MIRGIAGLVLGLLAMAGRVAGQERPAGPAARRARVTAITSGTVYIDAGRVDGLVEGAAVRVLRLGESGRYRVQYLSSRSAACVADSGSVLPAIGDTVEFVPQETGRAAARDSAGRPAPAASGRSRGRGLRGRIGFRYLSTRDIDAGVGIRQPGVELLLDGRVAPGAPVALSIDVRSRRTSRFRPDGPIATDGMMGVYHAAMSFQSVRGPFRAVVGRQYAPTLAGVGLFDGLLLDYQRPRWGAGVMAGLPPEPGSLALSSELRQAGGFLQVRSGPAARVRWSLSTGALGSYARTELNREFAFVQATLSSPVFSGIVLQEVDVNRGWKRVAGEPAVGLTSTFASVNLTPAGWLTLNGGIDNRRNVRLYRDLVTPEDVFDDRFRLGVWGGVRMTVAARLRVGADVRTSAVEGIDSLRTSAYTASASLDRVSPLGVGARLRVTWFRTPGRGPGRLVSGAVSLAPAAGWSLELNGGTRGEEGAPTLDRHWAGVETQIALRRSWFGLLSVSREWGPGGIAPTEQLYGGLSYRF